jgi:hypothetical protein
VALAIGLLLALYAYQRVNDPQPRLQRAREEAVVMAARDILQEYVAPAMPIETVDPVAPNSKVGKAYISPAGNGWEVSGHYRRNERDPWHPFLMTLNGDAGLVSLAVRDDDVRLLGMSAKDPKFSAVPTANP